MLQQLMDSSGLNQELKSILREGFCEKRSRFLKSWRQRWVVLTSNLIITFKERRVYEGPTEIIELKNVSTVKSADEQLQIKNAFKIETDQASFFFKCQSILEREQWIASISSLIIIQVRFSLKKLPRRMMIDSISQNLASVLFLLTYLDQLHQSVMMNQQFRRDRRGEQQHKKGDRTQGIIEALQRKMYSHFHQKPSEDNLMNSQNQQPPEPKIEHLTKGKNTFKLFSKPSTQPLTVNELDKVTPTKNVYKQSQKYGKSQMGQLIEEVEAIQALVRKKLALKQERVAQLQREIAMETEQKVHLYKINCDLEQELEQIFRKKQADQQQIKKEEKLLEQQVKRLTKLYQQKKLIGKKIKQQEDLLKQTLKNSHNHKRGLLEPSIRNHSREALAKRQQKQQEKCLRGLVVELDRLKKMVKQKMKKSKSKLKFK